MPTSSSFPKDEIFQRLIQSKSLSENWKFFSSNHQLALIDQFQKTSKIPLEVSQVGVSQRKQQIKSLRFGTKDKRRIMIWARQHGDEPECSAALNIAIQELLHHPDHPVYKKILENCDLMVLPMISPDGNDVFTRESIIGIDLNRDAAAQVTSEAHVLIAMKDEFDPEYAFNLHDMNPRRHTSEKNPELVGLAFQAGPYNSGNQDNDVRLKAKTVICKILENVEDRCPRVARYAANFMSRAFGDSMMRWGVSCILIESGSLSDDDGGDDEVIRLHALSLLAGLYTVAVGEDAPHDADRYEEIPLDAGCFDFDEAIRGGEVTDVVSELTLRADLGLQKHLLDDHVSDDRQFRSNIAAVGDFSVEYGAHEYDASGCILLPGLVGFLSSSPFAKPIPTEEEVRPYLEAGITTLAIPFGPFTAEESQKFAAENLVIPPPINIAAFERVSNLREIEQAHGASELRGFCLTSAVINLNDLKKILREKTPDTLSEISEPEMRAISLYFVSGSSPSKRHLHFCIGETKDELTSNLSSQELESFISTFALSKKQISFSKLFNDQSSHLKKITPNHFGDDLIPNPKLLPALMKSNKSGNHYNFLRSLTVDPAQSLRAEKLGQIRVGFQGNLIALQKGQGDQMFENAAPKFVFLNGECVVNGQSNIYRPRKGRWLFS